MVKIVQGADCGLKESGVEFGYFNCTMSKKHPRGDVEYGTGYSCLRSGERASKRYKLKALRTQVACKIMMKLLGLQVWD